MQESKAILAAKAVQQNKSASCPLGILISCSVPACVRGEGGGEARAGATSLRDGGVGTGASTAWHGSKPSREYTAALGWCAGCRFCRTLADTKHICMFLTAEEEILDALLVKYPTRHQDQSDAANVRDTNVAPQAPELREGAAPRR